MTDLNTQAEQPINEVANPVAKYHFCAFRIGKNGGQSWFDGVIDTQAIISTTDHYNDLKKVIAEHYDVPNSNLVIVCLTRLDTISLEIPRIPQPLNEGANTDSP